MPDQIGCYSAALERSWNECMHNDQRAIPDDILDKSDMTFDIGFETVLLFKMIDFRVHIILLGEAGNKTSATYFFKAS